MESYKEQGNGKGNWNGKEKSQTIKHANANATATANTLISKEPLIFKTTSLSISTCTVITNLNSKINLGLLTRFANVYDQNDIELDKKAGGIYNIEYYGNCARGETFIDSIKAEFNNQATIKFKYWGFRNVNIKIFANGKLQMTGLKYENEATEVAKLLIDIINKINITVITDITKLNEIQNTHLFQLVYDNKTKSVFYYRKYYDRFLKNYNFDTELVNHPNQTKQPNQSTQPVQPVNLNRKGFVKGIHDAYYVLADTHEDNNKTFLKENEWYGDNKIRYIINKIEKLKDYFANELQIILSNSKTLIDVKIGIENLIAKYVDFKFPILDKLLSDIDKQMFSNDEQTLIDIKHEIFKFNRVYKHFLEKKINRLVSIRTIDITICNYMKQYFINTKYGMPNEMPIEMPIEIPNTYNNISIPIEELELKANEITEPHNYFVSETETVLINSDFSINHNINLKKISKILKKMGLYNSYEPDEYPGVLTKYYYNHNNTIQGICNCISHCSAKEKHSICTKITISIFRPGSIIITGARNTTQLMTAHDLIVKVLKDNLEIIKGAENEDDNKQIALMNNEFRKISRKPRLFFLKKDNILDYDKIEQNVINLLNNKVKI
jgi:TATA-box binding protein (TBP) (component of TFIID and TFIIIB)